MPRYLSQTSNRLKVTILSVWKFQIEPRTNDRPDSKDPADCFLASDYSREADSASVVEVMQLCNQTSSNQDKVSVACNS